MNKKLRLTGVIFVLTILLSFVSWQRQVLATAPPVPSTITVTSLADGQPNAANCPGPNCRLRDAIAKAAAGDTIDFAVTGTITHSYFDSFRINNNLTINGPGPGNLTISGSSLTVFFIGSGVNATITGLTVANVYTGASGGGFFNFGNLALTNCTLTNDRAVNGGGIVNIGTLTITNSLLSNNRSVPGSGGAISNSSGATLTIINSTISGNRTEGESGGGIINSGNLNVINSTFSDNFSIRYGGGVYNLGTMTLTQSTFSNNSSNQGGGGIYNGGTLTINSSTLSSNRITYIGAGGGIDNTGNGTITNSTISGNSAYQIGGGIYMEGGTLTLTNSTISRNTAGTTSCFRSGFGGGISIYGGSVSARNTLIAGNFAYGCGSGPDVFRTLTSLGHNLIGNTNGTTIAGDTTGNLLNVDPLLGPLADNGGPTQTHALLEGSPAINAGDNCVIQDTGCLTTPLTADQRGADFPRQVGGNVDIGAFEAGTGTNTAPVANNDGGAAYTTNEDTALIIAAPGVLGNDSDAENNPLTAILVNPPANGTLSLNPNGSFTYTPNGDYNGTDSFTYKVNDGSLDSNTATVSLTVNAVNDPPSLRGVPLTASVDELQTLTFMATASDVDLPAQTLTFSLINPPAGATINPTSGQFSWTPTEAQGPGSYTVRVRVSDGVDNTEAETSITVNEVNTPPSVSNVPATAALPWGNSLAFMATAMDADLPAQTLTFSLVGAPEGATINPTTGEFSWTPSAAQLGSFSFTVRATDNGTPSLSDGKPITVNVGRRPTALTYTGATSGQYSDSVTLVATLTDQLTGTVLSGRSVSLQLGTQSISPVPTTDGSGVASGSLTLTQPAGAYIVVSQFAGDALYAGSGDSDPFTISKEEATTTYTGDTSALTAGPTITTASVRLGANLVQANDGAAGDITLARVSFELFKANNLSNTPDQIISGISVDVSGNALTTVNLGVDTWTIKVKVDSSNSYWMANPIGLGVLNIALGSTDKRVSGGGWVPFAGSSTGKANFGFTVNYQRNGNPNGNAVFVFRSTDPTTPSDPKVYDWVVKSNSWQGGGLSFYTDPSKASFNGKCNVQKIDPATGLMVASFGNYSFTADLKDGDLLNPRQADAYGITILDNTSAIWRQVGTPGAPVTLGGGNVTIQSR